MFSTISVLFVMLFTAHALRRDSLWTITLTPSDKATNDYEGEVEVLAAFKDGRQHAVILPSTRFQKSEPATFKVGFVSPGPLEMAYVRTHGVCAIGLLPLNVLRLRQVELESHDSNTTYVKYVEDLAIKDVCQSNKSLGTALKDFDEYNPAYCLVNGKKYADGQQVEVGCSTRCSCSKGVFGCVDMCPLQSWSPEDKCHYVHVPGQCCDAVRCEKEQSMNSCDAPVPATLETETNGSRTPVRRYPWSTLLCIDEKCSQVYGGVIVGNRYNSSVYCWSNRFLMLSFCRHIVTFAPDLTSFKDLRFTAGQYIAGGSNGSDDFSPLRVVNVTAHPDFVNLDSPIADSASRLQLLQLDQPLEFDKQTQAANLPFNQQQCAQLSKEKCPLMTVGWDRTDEQDSLIRQWFLHAEKSTPDQSACNNGTRGNPKIITGPKRRGEQRVCINGLSRSDCTGPLGGAVVASRGTVDFLVGILDPDAALFACDNRGTAAMLPICKYAEWIQAAITTGNL